MSAVFTYNGLTLTGVRQPGGLGQPTPWALTEVANKGEAGLSGFDMEDIGSAWSIVGLKEFYAEESATTPVRIFSGYATDRTIGRSPSMVVGSDRTWDWNVADLNARLGDIIFLSKSGKRPAETDVQRINWMLGFFTSYSFPVLTSALYDTSAPVAMDAADYTGRYPKDLLNECSNESGKTFYLFWGGPNANQGGTPLAVRLAYHTPIWSSFTAAGSISNVTGAANGTTVFAPGAADRLKRDPAKTYSGCYLEYSGGHVFVQNATTLSNFRHRDTRATDMGATKPATAIRWATNYLNTVSTEEDTMTVHLDNVPAASLGNFRPGQRVLVTLQEVTEYASGAYMAIIRRTVSPIAMGTSGLYKLTLDLDTPHLTTFRGAGHI